MSEMRKKRSDAGVPRRVPDFRKEVLRWYAGCDEQDRLRLREDLETMEFALVFAKKPYPPQKEQQV